jgi:hypothetical protein
MVRPEPTPHFDSGVLQEPFLAFGGRHEHVDPKTGLALYGSYSLSGQSRPSATSILVGLVGPAPMIGDAEQWLAGLRGVLTNDGSHPFLYPHFPGFNSEIPFQCDLMWGEAWRGCLLDSGLRDALNEPNYYERIKRVIALYVGAIQTLSQRDPKANVILCCMPQEVVDHCTTKTTKSGEVKRLRVSKAERLAAIEAKYGQMFLFSEMNPTLGVEDQESGHENLRRGLKAEAMRFGMPTQIVWPRTVRVTDSPPKPGERDTQDIATRAWNLATALYYKASGCPWRLASIEPGACFVGISFYKELAERNSRIRTSMAQAFTSSGDGYVLRGKSFEWDEAAYGKSPHMDGKLAASLIRDVLDLYKRQNNDSLPTRLVIHKTSEYWDDERARIDEACQCVPRKDLVSLCTWSGRGIQFYRFGKYPALRGTYVKFSDSNLLLYTVGCEVLPMRWADLGLK